MKMEIGNDTQCNRLWHGYRSGYDRLDGWNGRQLRFFYRPTYWELLMTPTELTTILNAIVLQLSDIMSFGIGALTGIAFVIASSIRWER